MNKIGNTAIVLAGGLGTRLRDVVKDIPKPMAPINNKPFLTYLLEYLRLQGIERIILSCGFKAEIISEHYGAMYHNMELIYSVESEPLGTGGAIQLASGLCDDEYIFVLNGDTYFPVDMSTVKNAAARHSADVVLSLKSVQDRSRYGGVEILENGLISAFVEKGVEGPGLINGGTYLIRRQVIADYGKEGQKWSFEADLLYRSNVQLQLYGLVGDAPFIDIGVPEDYLRAASMIL